MAPIPGISGGMVGATGGSLVYVGSAAGTASTTSLNVSLSGTLTGGIGTSPIAGDVVVVAVAQYGFSDIDLSVTGYTELCDIYSNSSGYDTNFAVAYKRMTATPDTSLTATSTTSQRMCAVAHVWRNVNATTPIDVTTTTATGTGTSAANPPSITPVTSGAVILACGGAAKLDASSTYTATQLSNFRAQNGGGSASAAVVGIGSYKWQGGAFDPDVFSIGSTSSSDTWAAATLALRP